MVAAPSIQTQHGGVHSVQGTAWLLSQDSRFVVEVDQEFINHVLLDIFYKKPNIFPTIENNSQV